MKKKRFTVQAANYGSPMKCFDVTTSATDKVMKGIDAKSFEDAARQVAGWSEHSKKGTIITVADRKGNTRSYEVTRKGAVRDVTGDTHEEHQAMGASVSAKRRFTVTASERPITPADRKRCIDFVARDYGVTKKQAAEWVKSYSDDRIRTLLGIESDQAKKAFIYDSTKIGKRRFTVTASSKRKAIGAGYTPKGRKVLWLFNADENQWVPWGTWSKDTVTEDEMYELSHRRFPNSEYDADYNYTDYMLLPNDGSEPDDGRPVRASSAPKRKFTVKAAYGSENITCAEKSDTLVIFYDGNFVSSGGWDGVRGGIHYIVSRDDAALRACIDYCNSFGDPLIGEDFASPRDVADTMADVIAAEYNDAWDSDEFFIHIPVSGTRGIEIFDKADMAVHASTAVKCSEEEEGFHLYGYDEDGADFSTGHSDSEMGLEDAIGNLFAYESVDTVDIYENGISGEGDYIGTITREEYDSDSTGRLLELLGMRDAAVESSKDIKCGYDLVADTADDTYTVDSFYGYN